MAFEAAGHATSAAPKVAPRSPVGTSPSRRPNSVRRTSSIDIDWPAGRGGIMRVDARARDLLTPAAGTSLMLAEGGYDARLDAERRILALENKAADGTDLAPIIGERAGLRLRAAIERIFNDKWAQGAPLYLILDDLAGASLVGPWAWSCWDMDWTEEWRA